MLTLFWLVLTLVTLVVLVYTNAAGVTWIVAVAALLGLSWAGGLLPASLNVMLTALRPMRGGTTGSSPDWSKLLAVSAPALTADEQRFLTHEVDELCSMVTDWETTNVYKDLPRHVWQFIKDKGFLGLSIAKDFGGLGFSAYAHSQVMTKLSTHSGTVSVTVMVPNSLGPGELLQHYGTDAQRRHYLPRLAKGLEIPCFALTNPHAGSDAAAIPDRGIVCMGEHEGKRVLGLRITWEKRYITLGPVATLLGLAFHAYDPEHLIGDRDDVGITCALIPTSHPGVSMLGRGWRMLMNALPRGAAFRFPQRAPAWRSSPCAPPADTPAFVSSSRRRSACSRESKSRSRAWGATCT